MTTRVSGLSESGHQRGLRIAVGCVAFALRGGAAAAAALAGSRHANMKELRFKAADGVWRVAFAFDPERQAILLVAGDKAGGAQKRFYKGLIAKADSRFTEHLTVLTET